MSRKKESKKNNYNYGGAMKAKLWTDGEDWVVAKTLKEAMDYSNNRYEMSPEEGSQEEEWSLVEPDKVIKIFEDIPGQNEESKTAAEWVKEATTVPNLLCSVNV